jgi:hypothetical protein
MTTHQDLRQALGALVTASFGSQRAMCRVHTTLVRPTVQAALSDRNALSLDLLSAILQACGVQDQDRQTWLDDWQRLGWPRQKAAIERRREGYDYAKRSRGRPWR